MKEKMGKGYKPEGFVDSPNLWRIMANDRLVWTGKKREGVDYEDGVLGIFTFAANAAVIGEPFSFSETSPGYGIIDETNQSPEELDRCNRGYKSMLNLPELRTYYENDRWTIEWV